MGDIERWWVISPDTHGVDAITDGAIAERARDAGEEVVGPLVLASHLEEAVDADVLRLRLMALSHAIQARDWTQVEECYGKLRDTALGGQ